MTKIQITPKWSEVKPQGYYVYLHKRSSDGSVFYVGKGKHNRAWAKRNYNSHWTNIAKKHGLSVEICQDNMTEDDAFLLEMWLIAKIRHEGYDLCNKTDGGDGVPGTGLVEVYCSNGMRFASMTEATDWVRRNVSDKASIGSIWSCCAGRDKSAYGFTWSYNDDCGEYIDPGERRGQLQSKEVHCSNGMSFSSVKSAAEWLRGNGWPKAGGAGISSCCRGVYGTAYGYGWSYTDRGIQYVNPKDVLAPKISVAVVRSDGVVFDSVTSAALSVNGGDKSSVSAVCRGRLNNHAGYGWKYVDKGRTPNE